MKGKTKVFRRMITYLLISDLISNYNKIFSNLYEIKDISDILFNKLTILKNYYNNILSLIGNTKIIGTQDFPEF